MPGSSVSPFRKLIGPIAGRRSRMEQLACGRFIIELGATATATLKGAGSRSN